MVAVNNASDSSSIVHTVRRKQEVGGERKEASRVYEQVQQYIGRIIGYAARVAS